ncbi:MAG: SprT family zinc-dependent metalloprotease [Nitrosomonadales bacterium]|nr:SprT family zinc-dependent metalloprotease [Nitrosomonadales bacterium]
MSDYQLVLPDGARIPYQLERRPRKTIGLKISAAGLVVHAPKRISQSLLENALLEKVDWIRKKLTQLVENQPDQLHWEDGAELLLLGNPIKLSLSQDSSNRKPEFEYGVLHLRLKSIDDAELVASKVVQWYKKEALTDFSRRLALFATKLGVELPKLYLSNAQSRWGSCNSKKEIRINWRLLQAPPHIINYVICHELAHLKQMNHSVRFWNIVESLQPDYKEAERTLKFLSPQLHRF